MTGGRSVGKKKRASKKRGGDGEAAPSEGMASMSALDSIFGEAEQPAAPAGEAMSGGGLYVKYHGRKYKVKTGPKGGRHIVSGGKKVYVKGKCMPGP
jgi:hypothetical protein